MDGFGLLCGHLVGDYIFQDDAQAKGKLTSSPVCAWHCLNYVGAIFLLNPFLLSWSALILIGLIHFPIDRWRLAAAWMRTNGQTVFLKDMSPWSVIVVDNTMHLVTLYVVAAVDSCLWSGWTLSWDQFWWVPRVSLLIIYGIGVLCVVGFAGLQHRQKIASTFAAWLLATAADTPAATPTPPPEAKTPDASLSVFPDGHVTPGSVVLFPDTVSRETPADRTPVPVSAFRPSPPMPVE